MTVGHLIATRDGRIELKGPRSLGGSSHPKGAFHPGAGRIWCRHAMGRRCRIRRASTSYADDWIKIKKDAIDNAWVRSRATKKLVDISQNPNDVRFSPQADIAKHCWMSTMCNAPIALFYLVVKDILVLTCQSVFQAINQGFLAERACSGNRLPPTPVPAYVSSRRQDLKQRLLALRNHRRGDVDGALRHSNLAYAHRRSDRTCHSRDLH